MALNWDKLSRLQRDYLKPKFALNEVTRQLKKRPNDPYLLAWHVDLNFQIGNAKSLLSTLDSLFARQPPIVDESLLKYLHKIQVERLIIFEESTQPPLSIGEVALRAWDNAAKTFASSSLRIRFWGRLFALSVEKECWDDAGYALRNAQREGLKSKSAFFAAIFAGQLSHLVQKRQADESQQALGLQAKLKGSVALATMKMAFTNAAKAPKDPIRVQAWADLVFMAQIYIQQGEYLQLLELWKDAPEPVKAVLAVSSHDLSLLQLETLEKEEQWSDIQEECLRTFSHALEESVKMDSMKPLDNLFETKFKSLQIMLRAVKKCKAAKEGEVESEANERAMEVIRRVAAKVKTLKGRTNDLTLLYLEELLGEPILQRCVSFWEEHRRSDICFKDLRPFIENLDYDTQAEFLKAITARANTGNSFEDELSLRQFSSMMLLKGLTEEKVDDEAASVLRHCKKAGQKQQYRSARLFALYNLATRDRRIASTAAGRSEEAGAGNVGHITYQTAFLAQHLAAKDTAKEDRVLFLYSVRQSILLGFASLAFEHYPHVKIKEMLNDTASHNLLSRISQIHPFNSTVGTTKVNPDYQLENAIWALTKDEDACRKLLCTDIQDFKYGQAFELLDLKRKFRSSLARHLCIIERRRIARLNGGVVDPIDATFDLAINNFFDIVDSRKALDIYGYESISKDSVATQESLTTDSDLSDLSFVSQYYNEQDTASQFILKETRHASADKRNVLLQEAAKKHSQSVQQAAQTRFSTWWQSFSPKWSILKSLAQQLHTSDTAPNNTAKLPQTLVDLFAETDTYRDFLNDDKAPYYPRANPSDPTAGPFPHADTFIIWYGILEALQMTSKALDLVDDHLKKTKTLPAKSKKEAQATATKLRTTTIQCYKFIRKDVQEWIDFLRRHGVAVLKSWAKKGVTGEALMELMDGDDVQYYARKMVDSLVDTLEGVLKVRVGK